MKLPADFNYKKSLIVCITLFLFGIIFGFVMFPKILRMGLQKVMLLLTILDVVECNAIMDIPSPLPANAAIRADAQDADP